MNSFTLNPPTTGQRTTSPQHVATRGQRLLIGTLVFVMLALLGGSIWLVTREARHLGDRAQDELHTISLLKTAQITQWRGERLADAAVLMENPFLSEAVADYLGAARSGDATTLRALLQPMQTHYHYADILLVDATGQVRLSLMDNQDPLHDDTRQALDSAWRERQAIFSNLHETTREQSLHLDTIAPLFRHGPHGPQPIGAIILQVDSRSFLTTVLQTMPTPSATAKAYLVQPEDGDTVMVLSGPRRQGEYATVRHLPLSKQSDPAVIAILGGEGSVPGKDETGAAVFAVASAVPETPWYLVAQIDQAEIIGVWRSRATLILGGVLLSITAMASLAALIWQRGARRHEQVLRESEARFRSITEQLRDVVFVTDEHGILTYVSPAMQHLFGFIPEEAIGQPFSAFLDEDEIVDSLAKFNAMIDARDAARNLEVHIRHKDGSFVSGEVNAIYFDHTGARGALGVIRDITERKQAEAALIAERASLAQRVEDRTADLRRANAELSHALQAKDEFLAIMSHELRTPLNAILGISESLKEEIYGPLNPRQITALGTVVQSGHHLLSLINDILDLAKIEAGSMEIETESTVVVEICQASLYTVQEAARSKNVALSFQISDPQLILPADPRQLKQILVNLLSNAVKFTPPDGQVRLTVTADLAQSAIRFAVQDNGIGIPASAMGRLFMPFTQLDSGLSREYEGTGVGLALVRRLVELHDGSVHVESAGVAGQGSCFIVCLPWDGTTDAPSSQHESLESSLNLQISTHRPDCVAVSVK